MATCGRRGVSWRGWSPGRWRLRCWWPRSPRISPRADGVAVVRRARRRAGDCGHGRLLAGRRGGDWSRARAAAPDGRSWGSGPLSPGARSATTTPSSAGSANATSRRGGSSRRWVTRASSGGSSSSRWCCCTPHPDRAGAGAVAPDRHGGRRGRVPSHGPAAVDPADRAARGAVQPAGRRRPQRGGGTPGSRGRLHASPRVSSPRSCCWCAPGVAPRESRDGSCCGWWPARCLSHRP